MVPHAALAAHRARVDRNSSGTKSHRGIPLWLIRYSAEPDFHSSV